MTDPVALEIHVAVQGQVVGRYSPAGFADALLSGRFVGPASPLRQITETSFALGMLTGLMLAALAFVLWRAWP